RLVAGHRVAAALLVRVVHGVDLVEDHRGEGDPAGPHGVGQVQLGGGPPGDADGGARQVFQLDDAQVRPDHEALAVIEGGRGEVGRPLGVAVQRPGGVADQDVHLAGLDGRLPLGGGERDKLHGVAASQDRRGDGAAEVDVKAAPVAVRVDEAK